ncbi:MAG: SDR family NAD(P)-dependent oxidoreductase, partial [Bacteroidales bacterium]
GDSAADEVYKWCVANSIEVNFLINNAGMAGAAEFAESTPEYSDKRILLNIRALTMLCRVFVPMLERNRQSYILNIGSLSAFFPIPYKSVYSSTKSYVLNFSMSISAELRKRGISVTVICPNGVETNSGTSARIEAHKNWGKWTKIDSRKLASFAIDQTFKGKVVAIPMLINRFLRFIGWLIPASMQLNMLEKEFAAEPRSK